MELLHDFFLNPGGASIISSPVKNCRACRVWDLQVAVKV